MENARITEAAAAKRRAEGAAREATRLGTIHELPITGTTPPINTTPPLSIPTSQSHHPPYHIFPHP